MTEPARRRFLRGALRRPAPQRPPWALAEPAFLAACTRCGDCRPVCPTGIVISGDGGYPAVDFSRGECTFCAACVEACRAGALAHATAAAPPWALKARVASTCLAQQGIECRACGDPCTAGAIRFSPRLGGPPQPTVDETRCTGCGACVAPCPASAITLRG